MTRRDQRGPGSPVILLTYSGAENFVQLMAMDGDQTPATLRRAG